METDLITADLSDTLVNYTYILYTTLCWEDTSTPGIIALCNSG